MNDLLLTYYGDDFTGSTDVMETLALGGVPTVLFFEPPSPGQLQEQFPHVRAVGVAGVSRSMTPTQMDEELPLRFKALKSLGSPLFHYKVCSTFDSSPSIGSIGHAAEIGWRIFKPQVVPLVVGAPTLNRFVTFSNLFARVGDTPYRLDRHPTMSKHPITPMNESDLRLHLEKQTRLRIGAMNLLHLALPDEDMSQYFDALIRDNVQLVLFDTVDQKHLVSIGRLIWQLRSNQPIFLVGSSGVEHALVLYWQAAHVVQEPEPIPPCRSVAQLIVMAGSAAPTTAAQINWALENGFTGIRINTVHLIDPALADNERETIIEQALDVLRTGESPLLYSAHGPEDHAIEATKQHMEQLGFDLKSIGERLGTQQGMILRSLMERSGLKRVCVAGGDTSGHVTRQLGIYALEIATPIAPGAPLCRAHSQNPEFAGLEISLKGGQNGDETYFGAIRQGHPYM